MRKRCNSLTIMTEQKWTTLLWCIPLFFLIGWVQIVNQCGRGRKTDDIVTPHQTHFYTAGFYRQNGKLKTGKFEMTVDCRLHRAAPFLHFITNRLVPKQLQRSVVDLCWHWLPLIAFRRFVMTTVLSSSEAIVNQHEVGCWLPFSKVFASQSGASQP